MSNPQLLRHLESSIEAQKQDLQTLLLDNQRLAAAHVALKQDLATSHANIQIFADAVSKTRAERIAEINNLIEELKRREEDAREVGVLKEELDRVKIEVEKLEKEKSGMEERAGKLKETRKVNAEAGKIEEVRWEIEYMRHEVDRGKAAIEYEKKIHADNLLHRQIMEENMTSMARELEQLRSELASTELRARAAAAVAGESNRVSSYPQMYGGSEVTYGGSSYTTTYGLHQSSASVGTGSLHQYRLPIIASAPYNARSVTADGVYQNPSSAIQSVPYSMQQTQAPR